MAEKIFKVDEAIKVTYQAPKAETGLAGGVAEIFLPNGAKDSAFPDLSLTEMDTTGVYVGEFIPDQQGEWIAVIHAGTKKSQVIKRYSVGAHNIHSVGETVAGIDSKIDDIDTPPMVS